MKRRKCWQLFYVLSVSIVGVFVVVFILPTSKSVQVPRFWINNTKEITNDVQPKLAAYPPISKQDNLLQYNASAVKEHGFIKDTRVVLVLTLCGHDPKQEEQVLVLLKSAVLTSDGTHIQALIVADSEDSYLNIAQGIASWPPSVYSTLSITYISVWYPKGKEWMKTFRTLCTTERLYYPVILMSYDAVIHVDTDVVFLRPVQELWNFFTEMNPEQFIAMAPEHEDPENAYYNSPLNRIPYYGKLGLNAGVILMNLTRIRSSSKIDWITNIHDIYKKYQHAPLHFADQDILNIFFHQYPDYLLELPCSWNYRNDYCRFKANTCSAADGPDGIALLHGNRGVFISADEPAFKVIYGAFLEYNWTSDVKQSLVYPMLKELSKTANTMCGIQPNAALYTKYLENKFAGE